MLKFKGCMSDKFMISLPLYSPRAKTHEQMLDDQDDGYSTHSIGIVENPLYADQEDYNTPSYANLKEKEAEVSNFASIYARLTCMSINFEVLPCKAVYNELCFPIG